MKMYRCLLALAGSLLFTLPALAADLIPIRMAHPPLAFHELPLLVATEKGFFEAEGLKVTHSFMTGGSEAATALMSGNIDVLNSALTQPMKLRAQNAPIKIIAGVAGVRDWGIVVDKKRHANINTLAELKGLRIATPRRGSDGEEILRFVLENAGFDLDRDVQLIQIGGFQNHLLALEKGDIDGSILAEPFFTGGVQQGTAKPLFDILRGDGPDILRQRMFSCLVVTDDFLKNRRDVAEKIVRATKNAIALMYKDPDAALDVAQKYFPSLDRELLKAIYGRLISTAKSKAYDTRLTPATIDAENTFLLKYGVLKKPLAYNDIAADMSKVW